jgi:hypothetical protein
MELIAIFFHEKNLVEPIKGTNIIDVSTSLLPDHKYVIVHKSL